MKYFLLLSILYFNFYNLYSNDYVINISGKKKLITEHKYSDNYFYRAIKLDGAFTDNFGNYGDFESSVTIVMKQGKIYRVDFSNKYIFQNNQMIFMEGKRADGGKGTGVGKAIIIATDNDLKNLLDSKCVYSIKYFKDTFFSIMKCKVNDIALRRLKNIKEIADE
tara:strand:+ start:29 stop:523 length:495 start_codon:yes stop_codon:yes gene_type:complete